MLYDYNYGEHLARIYDTPKGYKVWLSEFSMYVFVNALSIKKTKTSKDRTYTGRVLSMESWKPFSTNPKAEQLIPVIPNVEVYRPTMDAISAYINENEDAFNKKQQELLKGKTEQLQMSV